MLGVGRQRDDLYNQAQLEDQEEILYLDLLLLLPCRSKPFIAKRKAKVIKDEFFKKEEFDL